MSENNTQVNSPNTEDVKHVSRRKFLAFAGIVAGGAILTASSCKKDEDDPPPGSDTIDLGSGDTGVLNFMYAMKQLETALITRVSDHPYEGMADLEKQYFADMKRHDLVHRELLNTILAGNAIPKLEMNFADVDFNTASNVLSEVWFIKDLALASFNYSAQLFASADYLTIAAKMISVEGRHAAYIRNVDNFGTFSSDADANGLGKIVTPWVAVSQINKYFTRKISATNLPTK